MSRVLSLVLAGLLAALLVPAPAQAGPRPPDPERVQATGRASAGPTAKVAPATVDSDVYAYATTPSARIYFVVAGHLKLQLKSGSTTRYGGSFVDYVGNKSYKASADATNATAPTLKLESRNGKFAFRLDQNLASTFYSGRATSRPSKLKVPTDQVYLGASAHVVRSVSYAIVLTERSGGINNPLEYTGTLTLAYDANGRVSGGQVTVTNSKGKNVTHALRSSGYFSTSYFYTVAQVDKKFFGLTATVTGTSVNGFGFAADGSKTSQWVLSGSA